VFVGREARQEKSTKIDKTLVRFPDTVRSLAFAIVYRSVDDAARSEQLDDRSFDDRSFDDRSSTIAARRSQLDDRSLTSAA